MPPEILLTRANTRDDPVPGNITRVLHSPGYVAVEFTGRDEYGEKYNCILRLALKVDRQEVKGKFSSGDSSEGWEDSVYVVEGKFQDRQVSDFEGEWKEAAGTCYIGIYDLPPQPRQPRKKAAVKNRKRDAQLQVLRTGRKHRATSKKSVAARRRPKRYAS